ncbi:MAG: class I SAM-dependent methyltransferase [Candidatus Dormibacteria bacterium]
MTAQERWAEALAAWAIPEEILAQARESPWDLPPQAFAARAERSLESAPSPTHQMALDALPAGGTVLDVGAGGGAASLPLAGRAGLIVAVDQTQEMLDRMSELAKGRVRLQTVRGVWPDAAPAVPQTDVAVCANVAYNVPGLSEFVLALGARARRRVVLELTWRHPQASLNWLWERFWGLRRPEIPTAADAADVVREALGRPVEVRRWQRGEVDPAGPGAEEVAWVRRRLCLDPSREPELAEVLAERVDSGASRQMATIWWDMAAPGAAPAPVPGP